jgi:hypothetical protein
MIMCSLLINICPFNHGETTLWMDASEWARHFVERPRPLAQAPVHMVMETMTLFIIGFGP